MSFGSESSVYFQSKCCGKLLLSSSGMLTKMKKNIKNLSVYNFTILWTTLKLCRIFGRVNLVCTFQKMLLDCFQTCGFMFTNKKKKTKNAVVWILWCTWTFSPKFDVNSFGDIRRNVFCWRTRTDMKNDGRWTPG